MLLTSELTQPIVDKTMAILGKNINVMDHRAVIIASGDSSRLGTFHEGASRVIATGHPLEISLNDVANLQGVRPGVNLPIIFGGNIVGVVGISGDPVDIRSSGELVRTTVELMLEQWVLKEQISLETRARESFLYDLLTGGIGPRAELFLARAEILGYDLQQPRYAIVVDVDSFSRVVEEKLSAGSDPRSGELALQQLKERVLHSIERVFPGVDQEIVAFAGGDRFVVLKACNPEVGWARRKEEGTALIERIRSQISRSTGLTVTVGVGRLYKAYDLFARSFNEALAVIETGQRLWGRQRTFWAEDMLLENIVATLPEESLRNYADEVLGLLLSERTGKDHQEMFDTLSALFEHGLNVTRTAKALFVHRNTVMFRLEKLRALTGYRPAFSFRDAVELWLALLAWRFAQANRHITVDHKQG